ncbi:MAG: cell division ATP-binding protein FtsE [Gemmatimonadetes bacterium]|nr:cell division ATP-binding protein FtsE [Gemmatimonadota bacterium]
MIRFTHVYKEYPRSGLALKNVSFQIQKGEFAFLTGPSGAGKSTVLRLIHMADEPTDGEVRVLGLSSQTIRRRQIPELRRRVGMVFQDFRLLRDRTAADNIAFCLEVTSTRRSQIWPRVQRLLADVGLAAKAGAYPDELSGGEQQRVGIARALANNPVVLLADEPTGNLDERAARGVVELIRSIHATGMSVVMATHDLDLARRYPQYRVIALDEGALVSDTAQPETVRRDGV